MANTWNVQSHARWIQLLQYRFEPFWRRSEFWQHPTTGWYTTTTLWWQCLLGNYSPNVYMTLNIKAPPLTPSSSSSSFLYRWIKYYLLLNMMLLMKLNAGERRWDSQIIILAILLEHYVVSCSLFLGSLIITYLLHIHEVHRFCIHRGKGSSSQLAKSWLWSEFM